MVTVAESPYGLSESYTVKFWYQNSEGHFRQMEETIYSDSKTAHTEIEKYCRKHLTKFYKGFRILSITPL